MRSKPFPFVFMKISNKIDEERMKEKAMFAPKQNTTANDGRDEEMYGYGKINEKMDGKTETGLSSIHNYYRQ